MTRTREWSLTLGLAALLGLTIAGLVLTRSSSSLSARRKAQGANQAGAVDRTPLTAAENLAQLAFTPAQQQLAQQAIGFADQEVDVSLSLAVRHAMEHPASPTPETQALEARAKQAEARVQADEENVARLKKLSSGARPNQKVDLEDQLQLAQAQLTLDQDEAKDAARDLTRARGGEAAALEQMLEESKKSEEHPAPNAPENAVAAAAAAAAAQARSTHSLIARIQFWRALRSERQELEQARQDAQARAAVFVRSHDALEQQMKGKRSAAMAAGKAPGATADARAASIASLRDLQLTEEDLADLDKQIETGQGLAGVYAKWAALVATSEQAALHRMIFSVFWIVLLLLLAVVADQLIARVFSGLTLDRKGLVTARSVLHFSTRSVAAILVLIVIFGPPSQIAAILALAGAGLTVALKDFVVGFFGWFVLMGRNGMRPGDWVEINGVQGKVLEVGLLRTIILETGNWTDAGHPTGRKVTFVNSFAVEGHYFNFTTSGQWLWDEVQIGLPAGINPQPIVEAIRKVAAAETATNAQLAEGELQRMMASSGLRSPFTGAPTVTVRPTDSGMFIVVRYIARADEREALRCRLYHAALDLLVKENVLGPVAGSRGASSA